jgi:hypothetical protein
MFFQTSQPHILVCCEHSPGNGAQLQRRPRVHHPEHNAAGTEEASGTLAQLQLLRNLRRTWRQQVCRSTQGKSTSDGKLLNEGIYVFISVIYDL